MVFIYWFCSVFCRFGNEPSIMRYIKIAALLRDKTVRDVALRCRWMMVGSRLFSIMFFYLMSYSKCIRIYIFFHVLDASWCLSFSGVLESVKCDACILVVSFIMVESPLYPFVGWNFKLIRSNVTGYIHFRGTCEFTTCGFDKYQQLVGK